MPRKAKKRGNGEGSIDHMKDGRWRARISIPGGKQRAFFGTTRLEAADKLAAAFAERSGPQALPRASESTMGEWAATWLKRVQPTLKPRVSIYYEQLIRLHTLPSWRDTRLADLTADSVRTLYAQEQAAGFSAQSVCHLHALLHQLFEAALVDGLISRNPIKQVKPPRVRRHEMRVLSAEQARSLLAASADDRLGALYVVALTTGMRQGELLALRWLDVDLDAATAQVRGSLQRTRAGLVVEEPKTRSSRRQVQLTEIAVEALRGHQERQQGEGLLTPVVFASGCGSYIEAGNMLRRSFRPLLARAGLPQIRFHDLRHTAATLMLAGGVHPKIVSEMLGHARVAVTLDLYSHALPTIQAEAVKVLDGMLRKC